MRRSVLVLMLGLCLWSLGAVGCATDPVDRAMARSAGAVHDGLRRAQLETEDPQAFALRARYNPCRCPAPDFEIYLYGAWRRYLLEGDEDLLAALQAEAQTLELNGHLGHLALRGRFAGFDRTEEGLEFPVFLVESYEISG